MFSIHVLQLMQNSILFCRIVTNFGFFDQISNSRKQINAAIPVNTSSLIAVSIVLCTAVLL